MEYCLEKSSGINLVMTQLNRSQVWSRHPRAYTGDPANADFNR